MFSWQAVWESLPLILKGAGLTLIIIVLAMALSLVVGMTCAMFSQARSAAVRGAVRVYVEAFRNTPMLIQLFILYFGLPTIGIKLDPFVCGLLSLTLYTGAYNVEILRAGIEAVPKGQHDAARATGLSAFQRAVYVILPQALRISFPALGNNLVSLMKNSSLVSTIGMVDLMFMANEIAFTTFRNFEAYSLAVVAYVVLVLGITRALTFVEKRI